MVAEDKLQLEISSNNPIVTSLLRNPNNQKKKKKTTSKMINSIKSFNKITKFNYFAALIYKGWVLSLNI